MNRTGIRLNLQKSNVVVSLHSILKPIALYSEVYIKLNS